MKIAWENDLLALAMFSAIAITLNVIENLFMRLIPLPFIRLGVSNAVALYLIWTNRSLQAVIVTITKSILGGLATLTLLQPSTGLSLIGGLASVFIMMLARKFVLVFSIYGISIIGAITHNLTQLMMVRELIIQSDRVFMLTPILISLGLISGSVIGYVTLYIITKFERSGKRINETL